MTTPVIRTQAELPPVFHEVVGRAADVMYTIALYQEMGALMGVERLEPPAPGQEHARVRVLVGTPVLTVGPEDGRERWEIGDYFIASLMILRYLLFASVGAIVLWIGYRIVMAFVALADWIGTNGAAIASGLGGVLALVVLVMLLSLLGGRGGGCPGLHCGGCGKG